MTATVNARPMLLALIRDVHRNAVEDGMSEVQAGEMVCDACAEAIGEFIARMVPSHDQEVAAFTAGRGVVEAARAQSATQAFVRAGNGSVIA